MTLDGLVILDGLADGNALDVVVGARSRFFDGHFPGRPILPAIAQLALVEELLRRSFGDSVRIAGVQRLRLLVPVHPGDQLHVGLHAGTLGVDSARFEITRGEEQVTEGTVSWGLGRA